MIETYKLKAKSSSGDFYEVVFEFNNGKMSVVCGCIAGSFAQLCKHKDAFLNNDATLLFDESEIQSLTEVFALVCNSNYAFEFENYKQAVADVEFRKKELAKELKQIKGIFGRKLSEGL